MTLSLTGFPQPNTTAAGGAVTFTGTGMSKVVQVGFAQHSTIVLTRFYSIDDTTLVVEVPKNQPPGPASVYLDDGGASVNSYVEVLNLQNGDLWYQQIVYTDTSFPVPSWNAASIPQLLWLKPRVAGVNNDVYIASGSRSDLSVSNTEHLRLELFYWDGSISRASGGGSYVELDSNAGAEVYSPITVQPPGTDRLLVSVWFPPFLSGSGLKYWVGQWNITIPTFYTLTTLTGPFDTSVFSSTSPPVMTSIGTNRVICFTGYNVTGLGGDRTTFEVLEVNTSGFSSFVVPDYGPIGMIGDGGVNAAWPVDNTHVLVSRDDYRLQVIGVSGSTVTIGTPVIFGDGLHGGRLVRLSGTSYQLIWVDLDGNRWMDSISISGTTISVTAHTFLSPPVDGSVYPSLLNQPYLYDTPMYAAAALLSDTPTHAHSGNGPLYATTTYFGNHRWVIDPATQSIGPNFEQVNVSSLANNSSGDSIGISASGSPYFDLTMWNVGVLQQTMVVEPFVMPATPVLGSEGPRGNSTLLEDSTRVRKVKR